MDGRWGEASWLVEEAVDEGAALFSDDVMAGLEVQGAG